MDNDTLQQYAARMKELDNEYDDLKARLSEIVKEYDDLRLKKIPEAMAEMDIRSITYKGIGRVQLAADLYASIPADHKEAAWEWLRENNFGGLITETINAQTFKAFAKEQLKNGVELPEDMFKITPFTRASIVKV